MQIATLQIKSLLALVAFVVSLATTTAHADTNALSVVNINHAPAQELADVLVGIGLSRAEAIVAYREKFGPFQDMYELVNVRGVGERTVDLNEAKIRLK